MADRSPTPSPGIAGYCPRAEDEAIVRDACAEAAVSIQFQLRIHSLVLLGLSSLLLGPVRGGGGVCGEGEGCANI